MSAEQGNLPALRNWLKYRHLVLISTLARTSNMHTTAEQMGLSQPAVSKMLRDIEELFGFALFERLSRKLVPSELGQVVIQHAESTLNDTQRFAHQLDTLRKGGHGNIRVGAIIAATAATIPIALAELKRRRPLLMIELIEQTSDHLLEMLEHKQLDLVVARFTNARQQQRFDFQLLAEEPFWLVCKRDHPLSTQRDIHPAELTRWPWVLYPFDTPMRQMLVQRLSELDVTPPNNVIETTSVQTTLYLLRNSETLALLPEAIARQQVEQGLLCELSTSLATQSLKYGILTRKHQTPSSNAQELMEILLQGRTEI